MRHIFLFTFLFIAHFSFGQNANIHHQLDVLIEPGQNKIQAEDVLSFQAIENLEALSFYLNADLRIVNHSSYIELTEIAMEKQPGDTGMDRDDVGDDEYALRLKQYQVSFKEGAKDKQSFKITYEGKIQSPIEQSEENYQRGFSESPGIISDKGVYLAGSTYWVPYIEEMLMSFELRTSLPEGWKTVSQGGRTYEELVNGRHVDVWKEDKAQEEVFLIAAQFSEYSFNAGNVKAMAFLRTPDEALANKYLETTAQYLEMYRQLVGPFPYPKFALVENFWETGYGMPSFTLLGEKIIRFPFILHSSYPHELLHNWWGNSVYVDFKSGNWCEGITAYMADHLIKEQRGQGDQYRRTTLQKFADYVTAENDFPVSEFLSRHNASSEAIGYGKVSMIFHMLRQKLGDENFIRAIQRFNRENAFKIADWKDIEASFASVTEEDLSPFFKQWINRTGAPELALENVLFNENKVSFTLVQKQNEPAFSLEIPVLINTRFTQELHNIKIDSKSSDYRLEADSEITGIQLDPKFDVFRVLHPDEVPASLSKAYGADVSLFVLPSRATEAKRQWYKAYIEQWKKGNSGHFEVVEDRDLTALPQDKTIWILGFENLFAGEFNQALSKQDFDSSSDAMTIQEKEVNSAKHSVIVTAKHPANKDELLVFFSIENEAAIAGLVRKLPHYGKYSFLAFVGDEPTNTVKGQWNVTNSPLSAKKANVSLDQEHLPSEQQSPNEPTSKFLNRRALAYLAPVFSSDRIMEDIAFLACAEMKGRGIGSPELDEAATYIAKAFKDAGLESINGKEDYFQKWSHNFKDKGEMTLTNVIGVIPGSDEKYAKEPIVLTAHYDHLGKGWPDVHAGDEGLIHYGADDNASGVAIMIELARNLVKTAKPVRPIYFVACTAEEAGLIGSRYFVDQFIKEHGGAKPFANLNLDTNGRLFDKALLVLNGNTAREWKFIFMGIEYVTGVKTELVQQQLDASDQVAFNERDIPGVQLFSGAHRDYHRPTDQLDKLDPAGMVKVATVAKEVLVYLADRTDPMPYTGVKKTTEAQQGKKVEKKDRRAATGSMPDFAFSGYGVKIASVSEGSAADKAGLQSGDVIIKFAGKTVKNLREYSNALKEKSPGDKVALEVMRGEELMDVEIVLGER